MKKNLKNKISLIIFFAIFVSQIFSQQSSQEKIKYISPDNNGVQDNLIIPFRIKDKSRLESWSLVIENSNGEIVRTIGNKVALPTKITAGNIFKQIGKKKESVEIPSSVTWDGVLNTGETAPDGEYFYYFTAVDERGNSTKTSKMTVVVDNTRPVVTSFVTGDKIFGAGQKQNLAIKQNGSKEDLWEARVIDSKGNTVRNYSWAESEPLDLNWDGTNDNGNLVEDGVYKYEITSTDRAGNTATQTEIANIIFSSEKPKVAISIVGGRYFSTKENSNKNSITLALSIPIGTSAVGNKIYRWNVDILDSNKKVVRSYSSFPNNDSPIKSGMSALPPQKIVFDGKSENGSYILDGNYVARVSVEYLNGYKTGDIFSNNFTFDTRAPSANATFSDTIFSPDGDGNKDLIVINQIVAEDNGSPIYNWKGKIVNSNTNKEVFEYNFLSTPPKHIVWNGLDKNGALVQDGKYYYVLSAEDAAGNQFEQKTKDTFEVDTSKTEVSLAINTLAFCPLPSSRNATVKWTPALKNERAITNYNFEVRDKNNKVVFTAQGKDKLPKEFVWNGKDLNDALCADGIYFAQIVITSKNGGVGKAVSAPVALDTTAPYVDIDIPYLVFSPDGDGKKDSIIINTNNSSREEKWECVVRDSYGNVVQEYTWQGYVAGKENSAFKWDGTDQDGNIALDGEYSIEVSCEDRAGNFFANETAHIVLDTRDTKAYITTLRSGFSPISKTGLTSQKFNIVLTAPKGIERWSFDICNKDNVVVQSWGEVNDNTTNGAPNSILPPKEIVWDGRDKNGKYCEGNFVARLNVNYIKGNEVNVLTHPFICSVTPPTLSISMTPEFFSPDNDGVDDDLLIKLGGKTTSKFVSWEFTINTPKEAEQKKAFWTTRGTDKITEILTWNGLSNTSKESNGYAERVQSAMDYPCVFTATDSLGMTSTIEDVIRVDILVLREGDVLKMAVPSIIFRSNNADFKTADEVKGSQVTAAQKANNERVLKRVATILKKFPNYTVTVVGHANNITGTEEEETSTANGNIPLIPLSERRADFVKSRLVEYGIEAKRLTTKGKGGKDPVVPRSDRANWWKNRRVEFLLHK